MSETVAEPLAVAGSFDDLSGGSVCIGTLHSRSNGRDSGVVGREHELVDLYLFIRGGAENNGPREVRAITIDGASEVKEHQIALLERPIARAVMDMGRERAGSNDRRERDPVGTIHTHPN